VGALKRAKAEARDCTAGEGVQQESKQRCYSRAITNVVYSALAKAYKDASCSADWSVFSSDCEEACATQQAMQRCMEDCEVHSRSRSSSAIQSFAAAKDTSDSTCSDFPVQNIADSLPDKWTDGFSALA
jgi:hypothetical protein